MKHAQDALTSQKRRSTAPRLFPPDQSLDLLSLSPTQTYKLALFSTPVRHSPNHTTRGARCSAGGQRAAHLVLEVDARAGIEEGLEASEMALPRGGHERSHVLLQGQEAGNTQGGQNPTAAWS